MLRGFFLLIRRSVERFFHRLYLWTKPSYLRHRTAFQKQFDVKLIYTFWGCLIGILIIAVLFSFRSRQKEIRTPTEETIQIEKTKGSTLKRDTITPMDENDLPIIQQSDSQITTISLTLKKNETLSGLLKRADISMQEVLNVSKALDLVFDVRKIRDGQHFELFFLNEKRSFIGLKTESKNGDVISVLKNKKGEFIPQSKEGIVENKFFALEGIIETTFSQSAEKARIPARIVNQVIQALDGQVDFKKDLKNGEKFKVVYEQKMTNTGKEVGKSQLLYVSIKTKKETYQRYFFIDDMGTRGFYDENGESSPQTLMQRPLGKARISSAFGIRLHPILGYKIQHNGVDFAAKTGTPIPAGADGVIEKIGRNGGYGKFIKIKHNDTYSTAYGHLDSFNPDLRVGSYVRKGEVIGYVGNTGRSTGSHLHYEVLQKGTPVTPLKTYTIPRRVLKYQTLSQFKKRKTDIDSMVGSN